MRSHVIILPVDDVSNAAAEAVATNIKGVLAISHPYGRLQFGAGLELIFGRQLASGKISTWPQSSRSASRIGGRSSSCSGGSGLRREESSPKQLRVPTNCSESDTTSCCGASPLVSNAFDRLYDHRVTT